MSPRQQQPRNPHSPLTPTTSSSSMIPAQENAAPAVPEAAASSPSLLKPSLFSWKVLGGIFATLLVAGWVCIIVILIQEEKWQMVLVAWLLLYAAAHFCYWYFKRHHLLSLHSQICGRTCGAAAGAVLPVEKGPDAPPSYDDIIKSEAPPPAYYSVVEDSPKSRHKPPTPSRFPLFLQGLPKVFGITSSTSSPPSTSSSSSSSSSLSSSCPSTMKPTSAEESKSAPCGSSSRVAVAPPSPPSFISSGSLAAEQTYGWKSFGGGANPPPYTDSLVDSESQVIITPHTPSSPPSPSRRSIIRSISRTESVINEELHPIFSPIYKNNPACIAGTRPHTSQTAAGRASTMIESEREKNCSTPSTQ